MEPESQTQTQNQPVSPSPEDVQGAQPSAEPQEPASATQPGDDTPAEPGGRKTSGVQDRIDQLTREKWDARREADYWRQRAEEAAKAQDRPAQRSTDTQKEPQPDDFNTEAEYNRAVVKFEADKRFAEYREQEEQRRADEKRVLQLEKQRMVHAQGNQKYKDYDTVVFNPSLPVTQQLADIAIESEMAHEVLYHLGKHPEEAYRLSQMSPYSQAREIGKIEAQLGGASNAPPRTKSQAPKSIPDVGTRETGTPKKEEDMTVEEWWTHRAQHRLGGGQNK